MQLRRLNEEGILQFGAWIAGGASGALPLHLLTGPETSAPLGAAIIAENRLFKDRYEFGKYLNTLLASLEPASLARDRGLWTALALFWFDQLCPPDGNGNRKPEKEYRYILSRDFRHYYRQLVRSAWQTVHQHGEDARLFLLASREENDRLGRHGDILEQLGSRQFLVGSRRTIAEASRLYCDPVTGRPRKGATGGKHTGGSVRRLAAVMQQFDLTFDSENMAAGSLLALLPKEFAKWKSAPNAAAAKGVVTAAAAQAQ